MRFEFEQRKRHAAECELQELKAKLSQTEADLQTVQGELQAVRVTLAATNDDLQVMKAEASRTQLHRDVQGLIGKGSSLTLEEICTLVRHWQLSIKLETLRASGLTLRLILESKSTSLKSKLGCNYGTIVALVSFLRAFVERQHLSPPRVSCTDLLDTVLQRANCTDLKQLLVAQGVADDVLFEVNLELLGAIDSEIGEHLEDLERAIQGLRASPQTGVLALEDDCDLLLPRAHQP
eukprot:m.31847 g.31847  ORF g.31847 m.31847 type:complete len:236 (-) comp42066_c0_seq1:33-740(-)